MAADRHLLFGLLALQTGLFAAGRGRRRIPRLDLRQVTVPGRTFDGVGTWTRRTAPCSKDSRRRISTGTAATCRRAWPPSPPAGPLARDSPSWPEDRQRDASVARRPVRTCSVTFFFGEAVLIVASICAARFSPVLSPGDLDARPGLQPDPYDHGSNGEPTRNRAAIHQFQGDAPGAGGLSAGDQPASTSWSRAPELALSTNVAGHRPAPRRRSPRPLRASHDQTQTQELRPPQEAAKGHQTSI